MGTEDRIREDVEKKVHFKVYEYLLNNLIAAGGVGLIIQFAGSDRQFVYSFVLLVLLTVFGLYRGWKA